jgi:hypothetical protein
VNLNDYPHCKKYLVPFRRTLESVITFGKTKKQAGRKWFEYFDPYSDRHALDSFAAYADIATHNHFVVFHDNRLLKDTAPLVILQRAGDAPLIAGLLNSSLALFWLKQVCFNKGAGEDEHRDRFEFATKKVRQLRIPASAVSALQGKRHDLMESLIKLSAECSESGLELPSLALMKSFERRGEAYDTWNASLPGYVKPHKELQPAFTSTEDLHNRFARGIALRNQLRAEMIARQEEMDWLVYVAYELLSADDPAAKVEEEPAPLDQAQRPFRLWAAADGDFARAVKLIPADWPKARHELWQGRLTAIRDNEHIRRIEQPVYKRRWDEQWKVGNRWQSGQPAYDAEFIEAFDWWLSEKAEWWLEKMRAGGPVGLEDWTTALFKDPRVAAAWPVVAEAIQRLELWKLQEKSGGKPLKIAPMLDASVAAFASHFKSLVREQAVPEGIPFAVPYDKIKQPVPKNVQRIRGKLNVPRERFHTTTLGTYRVAVPFGREENPEQAKPSPAKPPFA